MPATGVGVGVRRGVGFGLGIPVGVTDAVGGEVAGDAVPVGNGVDVGLPDDEGDGITSLPFPSPQLALTIVRRITSTGAISMNRPEAPLRKVTATSHCLRPAV